MKTLAFGDLHTKIGIFDKIKKIAPKYDRIIFLGDACDDFGAKQEDNIKILEKINDFKQEYGENFIWLLGNHDWGYYDDYVKMSGHILEQSIIPKFFLEEHKKDWDIAFFENGVLYSHAGVSKRFLKNCTSSVQWDEQSGEEIATYLNGMKNKIGIGNHLNYVGRESGGWESYPGPIWARPKELPDTLEDFIQVVGHTPVEKITTDKNLIFCDTFSTYSNGLPIGNQAMLEIDNNHFFEINLNGERKNEIFFE